MRFATARKQDSRSAPIIRPGQYQMRNGHTANVQARLDIPFVDQDGEHQIYPIWNGWCVDTDERMTWQIDGTYSPSGKHPYDLVKAT